MEIGISLPTMAAGVDRTTVLEWCRLADQGPFSSISAGERMTFRNVEMWTTLAAAAVLTERLRIFANLSVTPAHPAALVAKQAATLDVLSGGRLTLGVGVGAREDDYRALDASYARRHARLSADVATLRSLWRGEPAFEGAEPLGPACVQPGGPSILAGVMGPKGLARAAQWADGVVGFSIGGVAEEYAAAADAARQAWETAERPPPRLVSGLFYVVGGEEPAAALRAFTTAYLGFVGHGFGEQVAAAMTTHDPDAVLGSIEAAEKAGLDELILVPGSSDLRVLEATIELVESHTG